MFHLINDRKLVLVALASAIVGCLLTLSLTNKNISNRDDNYISVLISDYCYERSSESLLELEKTGFLVNFIPINYKFSQYKKIKYVAKISRPKLTSDMLLSAVNGALKKCWTNSEAKFDVLKEESLESFLFYIRQAYDEKNKSVVIEIEDNEIFVRSSDPRFLVN
jgi:hypothetical protein